MGPAARRRRAVPARADRGPRARQFRRSVLQRTRLASRAARVVHQDGHCFPRRQLGRADDRRERASRSTSILTGAAATFVAYLFFWPIVYTPRGAVVRLQARRRGRARVGHLGVRRVGGHRDGRRDPREAGHSRHRVDGRRDLRDDRAHRAAGLLHGVLSGSADRQRRRARHDREDRRRRRRGRRAARRAHDRAELAAHGQALAKRAGS